MRKILFVMVAALAFVACEKDYQSVIEKTDLETVVHNNKVSLKQALLYAENSINGINPTTRSAERKVKSTELYVAKPATRSAEDTEVSFYLINYEDNEGFAMVSTDSRATPVYAYSDEGNLTPYDLENNPGLQIFMEGTIENYQTEVASPRVFEDPTNRPDSIVTELPLPTVVYNGGVYYLETTFEDFVKEPLLTTRWHQGAPYADNCPGGVAGCAPIAVAQIMAYHKHPAQFNGHTYNWNAITATDILYSGSVGAISVAQLVYDIGDTAGINYEIGTETSIHLLDNTLEAFGYNYSTPTSYNADRVVGNINNGQPVLMDGYNNQFDGHNWVIDGYNRRNTRFTYYYIDRPNFIYETRIVGSVDYFHCNMGLGRESNGYYLSSSFSHNNSLCTIYDITPNN